MMDRQIHFTPAYFMDSLRIKSGDIEDTVLVSGQKHRAQACLKRLDDQRKIFSFGGYTFWSGLYKNKKISVGNGGAWSPDCAFLTEILCAAGAKNLIRLGSCGSMRADIAIGDYVLAGETICGEGTSVYYADKNKNTLADKALSARLENIFKQSRRMHKGIVWTTDAVLKETKDIVNARIQQGAIAVDMVTSAFFTVAKACNANPAAVLAVSDNLITGQMGFRDKEYFEAEEKMTALVLEAVSGGA
jgi:purine-nucleoside phosphorylase